MNQPRVHRFWRLAIGVVAGGASILGLAVGSAPASEPTGSTTTTTAAGSADPPVLYGTTRVSGATVRTPGEPDRTLDANQMTAFVQTWLAYSVYNDVPNERPPDGVPVSHLAAQLIDSASAVDTDFLYATDGTKVWVGANTGPGGEEKWILAPDPGQTTQAFLGELEPLVDPIGPSTTTGATTTTEPSGGSSDNGATGPVGAAAAAAIVAIVAVFAVRARRRRPVSEP